MHMGWKSRGRVLRGFAETPRGGVGSRLSGKICRGSLFRVLLLFCHQIFFLIYLGGSMFIPFLLPPCVHLWVLNSYTFSWNLIELMSVSALSISRNKKRRARSLNGTSSKVQFDHFCGKYLLGLCYTDQHVKITYGVSLYKKPS